MKRIIWSPGLSSGTSKLAHRDCKLSIFTHAVIERGIQVKIMLCFDGSDEAREALSVAQKQAKAFNGEVLVVTSVLDEYKSNTEPFEQRQMEAQAFLEESQIPCKKILSIRPLRIQVGEDLLNIAARENVDEIIVGVRNKSKVGKLIFGSDAQYLILNAHCPVITVTRK